MANGGSTPRRDMHRVLLDVVGFEVEFDRETLGLFP
jgi:hypothetical protein